MPDASDRYMSQLSAARDRIGDHIPKLKKNLKTLRYAEGDGLCPCGKEDLRDDVGYILVGLGGSRHPYPQQCEGTNP